MPKNSDRDLQRYFDGELSSRQARKVHTRLEANPDDRARLDSLRQMRSMLREASAEVAQDADFDQLWSGVEAGIEQQRPVPFAERLRGWLRRYALIAAPVAAAAAVLLVLMLPQAQTQDRNDCVIESLEVGPGAVSTIFTIDDPGETGETTVIWVSANDELNDEGEM